MSHRSEAVDPNCALSMTPVPKAVSPYVRTDYGTGLTGARLFSSCEGRAAVQTKREETIRRTGAAINTSTNEERFSKSGYLSAAWLDDMPFGIKRYNGIFKLSDGLTLETQASNEKAEVLAHAFRPAEASS
ncbi:hypothetical protein [Sagittula marina]|uniref:hypothetical protein n=1 Tax=Sagittula marina TaxID=943940 RepID=UPI00160FD9EB|nr:hypothetical protein [Sagittula marina]